MEPPLILSPLEPGNTLLISRSGSRSPTKPRFIDDLISDLSPAVVVEAFSKTSVPGALKSSVEAATPTERAFGMRAAVASKNIHQWVSELSNWPWPRGPSVGFQEPGTRKGKELAKDSDTDPMLPDLSYYWGSVRVMDILHYESRLDEISQDMEALDVEAIKSQILETHTLPRSRPSSSGRDSMSATSLQLDAYPRLDDFTAVVTATVLQALPNLSKLNGLMETWSIRLAILRDIKPLMTNMADVERALVAGWEALEKVAMPKTTEIPDFVIQPVIALPRDAFETMKRLLQNEVSKLGQRIDYVLDTLEGREDTIPDEWLDRMEAIERDYSEWVVWGDQKVRQGEWAQILQARKQQRDLQDKTPLDTSSLPGVVQIDEDEVPSTAGESAELSEEREIAPEAGVQINGEQIYLAPSLLPTNTFSRPSTPEFGTHMHSDKNTNTGSPISIACGNRNSRSGSSETFPIQRSPSSPSRHELFVEPTQMDGASVTKKVVEIEMTDACVSKHQTAQEKVDAHDHGGVAGRPSTPPLMLSGALTIGTDGSYSSISDQDTEASTPAPEQDCCKASPHQILSYTIEQPLPNHFDDNVVLGHSQSPPSTPRLSSDTDLRQIMLQNSPMPPVVSSTGKVLRSPIKLSRAEDCNDNEETPRNTRKVPRFGSGFANLLRQTSISHAAGAEDQSDPFVLTSQPAGATPQNQVAASSQNAFTTGDDSDHDQLSSLSSSISEYAPSDASPELHTAQPAEYFRPILSPARSTLMYSGKLLGTPPIKPVPEEPIQSLNIAKPEDDSLFEEKSLQSNIAHSTAHENAHQALSGQAMEGASNNSIAFGQALAFPEYEDFSPLTERVKAHKNNLDHTPPGSPTMLARRPQLFDEEPLSLSPYTPVQTYSEEAPVFSNVAVTTMPQTATPAKNISDSQLQRQISEILSNLPSRIAMSKTTEPSPQLLKKRASYSTSFRSFAARSTSPLPMLTLTEAAPTRTPRIRPSANSPEIKLYHLSRSSGEAPIKLFVRLVGENGERVMVRVGGGWADLGEYLKEYASHHGRRSSDAQNGKVEVHGPQPTGRNFSAGGSLGRHAGAQIAQNSGRSSPYERRGVSMGSPRAGSSDLAVKRTRNSIGEGATTPPPMNFSRPIGSPIYSHAYGTSPSSPKSRSSSRASWLDEERSPHHTRELGLAGPTSRKSDISKEKMEWVENMKEKVRMASAEKEKRHIVDDFGKLGTVGSTKRLFKKST